MSCIYYHYDDDDDDDDDDDGDGHDEDGCQSEERSKHLWESHAHGAYWGGLL